MAKVKAHRTRGRPRNRVFLWPATVFGWALIWITLRIILRWFLCFEALHRGPGLDECAVNREVFGRQEPLHLGPLQHSAQKACGDIAIEESVAVFGEGRVIPNSIVDAEPNEPAERQVEVEPLHQLPLGADRVERLQKHCP